jgi:hypothetical protein
MCHQSCLFSYCIRVARKPAKDEEASARGDVEDDFGHELRLFLKSLHVGSHQDVNQIEIAVSVAALLEEQDSHFVLVRLFNCFVGC